MVLNFKYKSISLNPVDHMLRRKANSNYPLKIIYFTTFPSLIGSVSAIQKASTLAMSMQEPHSLPLSLCYKCSSLQLSIHRHTVMHLCIHQTSLFSFSTQHCLLQLLQSCHIVFPSTYQLSHNSLPAPWSIPAYPRCPKTLPQ